MLRLAFRLIPPRRQVLVSGWPDREGNAVALIRYIARTGTERRLIWLVGNGFRVNRAEHVWSVYVRIRRKYSLLGVWAYLRSDVICFTHGLYQSPSPARGRVIINLWHGDGPKRSANVEFEASPRASAVVAQTVLWGTTKAAELRMPASSVIVSGNPRVDDFYEPISDSSRLALSEIFGSRYLVWMPTYRESNGAGGRGWRDAQKLSHAGTLTDLALQISDPDQEGGIRIAVRPHPMDVDSYADIRGLTIVTDQILDQLQISLYQFLGQSSGLITDYSSTWTDYLILDRPIILFCPDLDEYAQTRGFNIPDLKLVAPGELVTRAQELVPLIKDIHCGRDTTSARRHDVSKKIGAVTAQGASARLWEAIQALRSS